MHRKLRTLTLFLPIVLIAVPRVQAESIRLTSGRTFQGQIIGHDDRGLRLSREKGLMDIPYRMITAIETDLQPVYPQLEDLQGRWQNVRADTNSGGGRYVKGGRDTVPAAKNKPVVEVYLTMWCPYCRKMESFLKKNGIPYRRYNIEADQAANRRYQAMGGGGIPLTRVGDYIIRGYDPQAVLRALR